MIRERTLFLRLACQYGKLNKHELLECFGTLPLGVRPNCGVIALPQAASPTSRRSKHNVLA